MRLIVSLTGITGLVFFASSLAFYAWTKHDLDAGLTEKNQTYRDRLISALELPLRMHDDETVGTIAKTFISDEIIAGLTIKDHTGRTLHELGDEFDPHAIRDTENIYHHGTLVGEVDIHFSDAGPAKAIRQRLLAYAASTLLTLISLAIAVPLLLRSLWKGPVGIPAVHTGNTHPAPPSTEPLHRESAPLGVVPAKAGEDGSEQRQPFPERNFPLASEFGLRQYAGEQTDPLTESEARIHQLFERKLIGMAITSPEKNWLQVNDKFCEMTGYSREELMRMTWDEMTVPDDLPADLTQFERMLCGEIDNYMLEKRFICKDGGIVFVHLTAGCVRRSDRTVDYVLGLMKDISERKLAEENIKKLNADLQMRANALEEANQELKSFSYSVSHDLRAPLRAIDGFSRMLQEDHSDKLDDEGRRLLGVVRDSVGRMSQLIDDILKFSRTTRADMNLSEIDMTDLTQEVVRDMIQENNGAEPSIRIGAMPPARGDRPMIRQVLVNLLSNAIKFGRGGARRIAIGGFDDGNETTYFVKDDGIGFDMHNAHKLFGVFQRLHSTTEFEGNGIGLAIVKRIVARHGGRVWAEGEAGVGATFFFTLPASTRTQNDDSPDMR